MEKMEKGLLTSLFKEEKSKELLKEESGGRRRKLISLWKYFLRENQKGRFLFLYEDVVRETGIPRRTLARYLSLLEKKSLIYRKRKGKEGIYVRVKTDMRSFKSSENERIEEKKDDVKSKVKDKVIENQTKGEAGKVKSERNEVREIVKDVVKDFTEEMKGVFSALVEAVKGIKKELIEEEKEREEKKEEKGENESREENKGERVKEEEEKKGKILTLRKWKEKKTKRGMIRIFYPEWFIWVRGEERRANVYQWLRGVLISVLFVKAGEWIGVFLVPEEGGSSFSVKLSYFKREVFSVGGLGEKEIKERLVSLLGREVFCFFSSNTGFYFGGEIGEKGLSIFKSFIKDCAEIRVVLQKRILERGVSPKIYSLKGVKIVIE